MLKRDKSIRRARKDNYTALLLGIEGAQAYFNLMRQAPEAAPQMMVPSMFGNSTVR
jgi:hypothetical protein